MVAIAPILTNDLSIASTQASAIGTSPAQQTVLTAADLTGPGPDPTSAMQKFTASNNVGLFQYPSDLPAYYMTLLISKYARQNWQAVGTLNSIASITLPLPMTMIDNHKIEYDVEPILWTGSLALNAIGNAFNTNGVQNPIGTGGSASAAASSVGNAVTVGSVGAVAAGAAASALGGAGVLAAAGAAMNSFMTVMLKGPIYKRRQFQWKFSPRSPAEQQQLQLIRMTLSNAAAPSLYPGTGVAFFRWPCIISPSFNYYSGNPGNVGMNTFLMKKSVIEDMSWNFTPAGKPAFYAGTHAPESIELVITFLELEYWLSDQNGGGITGDYNYKPDSTGVSVPNGNGSLVSATWDSETGLFGLGNLGSTVNTTDFNNAGSPLP